MNGIQILIILGVIFAIVLVILWMVLPFIVLGISRRLDLLIAEVRKSHKSQAAPVSTLPIQQSGAMPRSLHLEKKAPDGRYVIG